jgi:hypothetical protein
MKQLLAILILAVPIFLSAQTVGEQLEDILEQPDTIEIINKVYAPHYYLDSNDVITDYLEVREEIEWYMLERIPSLYPNREVEYLECLDNEDRTNSFLNMGSYTLPVQFRWRIFESNTQFNPTDNDRLVVYYHHCFLAIREREAEE